MSGSKTGEFPAESADLIKSSLLSDTPELYDIHVVL